METPAPTLEDYNRLIAYLPLLYGERSEPLYTWVGHGIAEDGTMRLGWPEYAADVTAFFREISRPVWIDFKYTSRNPSEMLSSPERIRRADLAEMRSMLTCCLRGERFSDGFWGAMIEEGTIRRLLDRLAELRDEAHAGPPPATS